MFDHWLCLGGIEEGSVALHCSNEVWVNIGCRSSILDIALAVGMCGGGWDTEGGSPISDTEREFTDV